MWKSKIIINYYKQKIFPNICTIGVKNLQLTWLDFYMVASLEFINGMMEEDWVTGKYSELEALMEKIKKLPGVQDYILTRPDYKR